MIRVKELSKNYNQTQAVNRVSFEVQEGQTLVLIGTSGCGKTTILRMLNRLIEPTSGSIEIDNENIKKYNPVELRRRMGYVIQDIGLFPHYTVQDNIAIVPRLLKMSNNTILERVKEYMTRLKIPFDQYAKKYPHELSGGQQQRVGLARALAADPPFILMDEPFGALDPITRREVRQDFKELDELSAKTTILVTHDILEAIELGDRICILDKGRIQQLGSPKELIFHPANQFVKSFMSGRLLELKFKIITLKDLFPSLKSSSSLTDSTEVGFSPGQNLMQVLSQMMKKSDEKVSGKVTMDGLTKTFTLGNLIERFQEVTQAS